MIIHPLLSFVNISIAIDLDMLQHAIAKCNYVEESHVKITTLTIIDSFVSFRFVSFPVSVPGFITCLIFVYMSRT